MSHGGSPFKVLAHYDVPPGQHYGSIIGPAIFDLLRPFNLEPMLVGSWGPQTSSIWHSWDDHAEVRRFAQPSGQGRDWHKDGDLEPNASVVMDHAAVLWAEITPTQFKTDDGVVHRPDPGDIVIARNLACLHRCPPDAPEPPTRRWFFRQRVVVPEHINLP